MTDRYNPFGLPYLAEPPPERPNDVVDSRFPDQQSTADAYRMGGLAAMDQYRMQDAPHAVFGAYDRARGQEAKDEAALQGHQRRADALRSFAGQGEGPTDIRSPITGMNPVEQQRMADTIGNALAPDNVFDAATFFNPLKRLGAIGKALPALGGIVMGADPAEAGVLSKARAVLGGKVGGPTAHGIHVYHSSPHDFDRFDLSKIGTGEGAQVYGHGIYAAENPAVSGQGGQYWKAFANKFGASSGENTATEYLARAGFDREKAMQTLQHALDNPPEYTSGYNKMMQERMRQDALKILEGGQHVGPRTYEVNFRAKPEELLDWDKPVNQQSPEVQDRLHSAWIAHRDDHARMTGEGIYGTLEAKNWDSSKYRGAGKPAASQELLNAGIPGIRYLDEGSRGQKYWVARHPQGGTVEYPDETGVRAFMARNPEYTLEAPKITHNYVAFDPSKLDIMAKYGVVGGVPLMGGLAAQDNYRQ